MWKFSICQDIGTVNELYCSCDKVAGRMMDTFERAGYRWSPEVDGSKGYTYRMDRTREDAII